MQDLQINTNLNYYSDSFEFDENFKHIKGDSYLYIDYGNLSNDFYESNFFTLKSRQITKLKKFIINAEYLTYNLEELKGLNKDDLFQIISDKFLYDSDLDEIEEFYNDNNFDYIKNYHPLIVIK